MSTRSWNPLDRLSRLYLDFRARLCCLFGAHFPVAVSQRSCRCCLASFVHPTTREEEVSNVSPAVAVGRDLVVAETQYNGDSIEITCPTEAGDRSK